MSKSAKGKAATKTVVKPSFWKHVIYTIKVMSPLVQVLRLVDSEKKPAMGFYEVMCRAKETIANSSNKDASKYEDVMKNIDERWSCQLNRPLHISGRFLKILL